MQVKLVRDSVCTCSYSDSMLPFPQWTHVFCKFVKTQAKTYLHEKQKQKTNNKQSPGKCYTPN